MKRESLTKDSLQQVRFLSNIRSNSRRQSYRCNKEHCSLQFCDGEIEV